VLQVHVPTQYIDWKYRQHKTSNLQRVAYSKDELERYEVAVDGHHSEHPGETKDRKNHEYVANERPDVIKTLRLSSKYNMLT